MTALARAIRNSEFTSARGTIKFNVNGFAIQPFWKLDIAPGPDGKPTLKGSTKLDERRDSYWEKCPESRRI